MSVEYRESHNAYYPFHHANEVCRDGVTCSVEYFYFDPGVLRHLNSDTQTYRFVETINGYRGQEIRAERR